MGTILCDKAKEYDVRFLWENVHWCVYQQPNFAHRLLEYCDHPNLGFTLDNKQAMISGYTVDAYIEDMGSRLSNVHICDYYKNKEGYYLTCLPGTGDLDLAHLKSSLQEAGYDGQATLEVYSSNYQTYAELSNCFAMIKRWATE